MFRNVARSKGTWVAMLAALGLVLTVLLLTSPGSHPKPAQAQTTQDPLAMAKASLVIDNHEIASFNELPAGITSSIKLPRAEGSAAQLEPLRISLQRPASDFKMSAWHEAATTQTTGYKKNVTLIFYDPQGEPTMKFYLSNAWPAGYHLDAQKAGSSSLLYERVTLTASSFQRVALH